MAAPGAPLLAHLVAGGAALAQSAVLAHSALNHGCGSFRNPAIWLPLVVSSLRPGFAGKQVGRAAWRCLNLACLLVQIGAAVVKALGLVFYAFNITDRPGGSRMLNLVDVTPIGDSAALIMSDTLRAPIDRMGRESATQTRHAHLMPDRIGALAAG